MKKLSLTLPQVSRSIELMQRAGKNYGEIKMVMKIEERISLTADEVKRAKIKRSGNDTIETFDEKFRKEVDLSDDMFNLMKKTYLEYFEPENGQEIHYAQVKHMLVLEEIFGEEEKPEQVKKKK